MAKALVHIYLDTLHTPNPPRDVIEQLLTKYSHTSVVNLLQVVEAEHRCVGLTLTGVGSLTQSKVLSHPATVKGHIEHGVVDVTKGRAADRSPEGVAHGPTYQVGSVVVEAHVTETMPRIVVVVQNWPHSAVTGH